MNPEAAEHRLAAILSADVVGYSRLMAEDEAATVRTLGDYREEVGMLVRQHRGRVVDFTGDNVLAEFPSATDAVSSAIEIQGVLRARNDPLPANRRMEFRIGVHLSEVRVEEERIYGDGVNIAARLEGLAEAGGICISSTVYEQVEKKLPMEVEPLGEQVPKNIARPVFAYRVHCKAEPSRTIDALPGMAELTVPGFGGAPAIAVLPFDNLSGDPDQEYFADGIAEDLITRLSLWRTFPVIARNSSFVYKGGAVDVKRVSRELGVRYVVEGSVRRSGDRVRISAQLIDATTGHHVWAERYDRELRDVFALQDEITEAIVAAMHPAMEGFERERAARKEPRSLDAWESVSRGFWHLFKWNQEDTLAARALFERAVELDPQHAPGHVGLGFTHWMELIGQWTDSPMRSIAAMEKAAEAALAADARDSPAHLLRARTLGIRGHIHEAIAECERAIELDPSEAFAYASLGMYLALSGKPDEGIEKIEKAVRLSPEDEIIYAHLWYLALAHFVAGRYRQAIEWSRRSLQRRPDFALAYTCLAASYSHLGQLDEARRACEEGERLWPRLGLAYLKALFISGTPDFLARYFDGLRRAGMKE